MIYPEIQIEMMPDALGKSGVRLSSTLRKEHEGQWYLVEFQRDTRWDASKTHLGSIAQALLRFNLEVYTMMHIGQVDLNLNDDDNPVFVLDEDQRPETERLLDTYYKQDIPEDMKESISEQIDKKCQRTDV